MASLASQVQRRVLDLLIARNFQQALKLLNSLLQKHPNNEILRLYGVSRLSDSKCTPRLNILCLFYQESRQHLSGAEAVPRVH
jgi:hypothetical protein